MSNTIRRVLIVVLLAALIFIVVSKLNSPAGDERIPPEKLEQLLDEMVNKRWNAMCSKDTDWITVYETLSPELRAKITLIEFMQNKHQFYFENPRIHKPYEIDGYSAKVKITYDWGVDLEMEIDEGVTHQNDVNCIEFYKFYENENQWFLETQELITK